MNIFINYKIKLNEFFKNLEKDKNGSNNKR